jgi:WD40 repeat protein
MNGFLASTSWDNTISIWNTTSGKRVTSISLSTTHFFLKQTSISNNLASCDNTGHIYIWNLDSLTLNNSFSGISQTGFFMESLMNGHLLTASWDGFLQIWNFLQGVCVSILNPFYDVLAGVHLISNATFVTFGGSSYALLIEIDENLNFKLVDRIATPGKINDMLLLTSDNLLLFAVDSQLVFYNLSSAKITQMLNFNTTNSINYLAYSGIFIAICQ